MGPQVIGGRETWQLSDSLTMAPRDSDQPPGWLVASQRYLEHFMTSQAPSLDELREQSATVSDQTASASKRQSADYAADLLRQFEHIQIKVPPTSGMA
jgi:hypothetical protein